MIRRLAALLAVLALAAPVRAETDYVAISTTDVSATLTLNRLATSVMICNNSTTARIFVRIFSNSETAAAATTAYTPVPIAASANYPYCITVDYGRAHPGTGFWKISHIAAAGQTPTGFVVSE